MDELIQAILKSYGVIGLLILTPVIAVVFLWKDNVRLNNELRALVKEFSEKIDDMGKRVVASQEKRVDDSHSITSQLVEMISEHTASAKETATALDRVGDMVSMLNAQFNGIQMPPRQRGAGGG